MLRSNTSRQKHRLLRLQEHQNPFSGWDEDAMPYVITNSTIEKIYARMVEIKG